MRSRRKVASRERSRWNRESTEQWTAAPVDITQSLVRNSDISAFAHAALEGVPATDERPGPTIRMECAYAPKNAVLEGSCLYYSADPIDALTITWRKEGIYENMPGGRTARRGEAHAHLPAHTDHIPTGHKPHLHRPKRRRLPRDRGAERQVCACGLVPAAQGLAGALQDWWSTSGPPRATTPSSASSAAHRRLHRPDS